MRYDRQWSFYNPVRVRSGPGLINELPAFATQAGSGRSEAGRGLIVTSPGFTARGLTARVRELFGDQRLEVIDAVRPNPDIKAIETARARLQGKNIQFIIGIGGGSVLDTAKSLSYLLSVDQPQFSLKKHLVDKAHLPQVNPLFMIAVPTTAGTGSEATNFATVWDSENQKKYSLTGPNLFPGIALLDPELTLSLPEETTVVTGLDVLSHALESVWNFNAGPVSISYAARAIDIVLDTLPALLKDPHNLDSRSKMLTGSLCGGICISATRTALAHSISYPITAALGAPHGLACSFTLPALLKFNAKNDDGRIKMAAALVGCSSIDELLSRIRELFAAVDINKLLARYQVSAENVLALSAEMFTPERSGNNLRPAGPEDVKAILHNALYNSP